MRIYRTTSMIELSMWAEKQRAFIRITPAAEGATKGQPKAGEKRFNYDETIAISFTVVDMLTTSYSLEGMSKGIEGLEVKKFADMSKVAASDNNDQKKLTIAPYKENISFNLSHGTKKANITLSPAETYTIAKWFEFQAQKLILTSDLKQEEPEGAE